ncbi:hypothetical protein B0J11DRAFT_104044 [Dendryphion nanum]|uniref:FAD/NAD(P)-binding domain-containing protein n=1 Tax=Dendryphion nanum TaxID=256645 RepID=A0A9P9DDH3_9PLEO|nr:hypothetical protein B0J11DRAFT_104044 [Dendryphion nanum]
MADQTTILILGGSFAGLASAHYALRHILPKLPANPPTPYTVTLVNPSADFWWRIGAPRSIASPSTLPFSKTVIPIAPAFSSYGSSFLFVEGAATAVDPETRTTTIALTDGTEKQITYTSLIIATGFSTPCPLFTVPTTGDTAALQTLTSTFQKSLSSAKTVVIGGGGPVGVETAGEIAEVLNGKPGFFAPAAPKDPKAKITIVTADSKMLPVLRAELSKTAEKHLKRLGVEVQYGTKVVSATEKEGAKTAVQLSSGETIEADIYIDATGSRPNSSFLPPAWLDARARVAANAKTLRVDASPRTYVVGDVGSYTRGGALDLADAIPVALTNLRTDLVAHLASATPGPDRVYTANLKESQLVPIGSGKGVGAFNGNVLPSLMVWGIKGRDYMLGMAKGTVNGDAYKKEGKWVPEVKA